MLLTTSRQILTKLQEKMTKLEGEIISETADLEQLKYVLNVIAEVQQMTQVRARSQGSQGYPSTRLALPRLTPIYLPGR